MQICRSVGLMRVHFGAKPVSSHGERENEREVGIAGFGTIGKPVAAALIEGSKDWNWSRSVRATEKAKRNMDGLCEPVPVVDPQELAELCDVIVECVPKAAFRDIAEPALNSGRTFITVSGAGLLIHPDVVDIARDNGGQIILATGALLVSMLSEQRRRRNSRCNHDYPEAAVFIERRALPGRKRYFHRKSRRTLESVRRHGP